jgi:predicted YcjX-like family ATPase
VVFLKEAPLKPQNPALKMSTFFAQIEGKVSGPFDAAELKRLAAAGRISDHDQISKDGKTGWVAARNVHGLFPPPEPGAEPLGSPTPEQPNGRSIGDAMLDVLPKGFLTTRRRIAITGLASTGKTVFMTTLINHLKHHDPTTFRLFQDKAHVTVKHFAEDDSDSQVGHFDHSVYADAIRHGTWPSKTLDVSAFSCRFNTDRDYWGDYHIEFLDWPGERLADAAMYKQDYTEWSDNLLKHWAVAEPDYRRHVAPYLAASQRAGLTEKSILAEYRLALAQLIMDFKPLISPSCFVVGQDGNRLKGRTAEDLAAIGVAGLDIHSQFAPLPKESRRRQPDLNAIFSHRYEEYRNRVVHRLFGAIQRCNRLIVLVDIPAILASGHGMLNDNYKIVEQMLNGMQANSGFVKRMARRVFNKLAPASWMWSGIEKIAFVATKADLVGGQENKDNLLRLLKEVLRDIVNRIEGVQTEFFVASPVSSTSCPPDGSFLIGKLMFDALGRRCPPDSPEQRYTVPRVPDAWPEHDWPRDEFNFPDVYPAIPQAVFRLPKHIGLDDVFRFILG